jgi:hypothetical protein
MGGNNCGGRIIHQDEVPKTAKRAGIKDARTFKPFMFSALELTGKISFLIFMFPFMLRPVPDDDAFLGVASHHELGS